jgi:predicted nucleic acid-binding protein
LICYFDSSALVKLWLVESGSDLAAELWRAATLRITSPISYVECRAALSAAARAGRLPRAAAAKARSSLDAHWRELNIVHVDGQLIATAGDLAESDSLRGFDAVQLASALAAAEHTALAFVSWDTDLSAAALGHGLAVPA